MIKRFEKGFSILKLIIFVVLLAVLSTAGFYAYKDLSSSGTLQQWIEKWQEWKQERKKLGESRVKDILENRYIRVTSPNGGEEWDIGKTYTITWGSKGVEGVNITILDFDRKIACDLTKGEGVSALQGKYSYTVQGECQNLAGDRLKVQIWNYLHEMEDESDDYFTIKKDETIRWENYKSEQYGFEIKYPEDSMITGQGAVETAHKEILAVKIENFPVLLGTNLSTKYFELMVKNNDGDCSRPVGPIIGEAQKVSFNNINFTREIYTEGAAGHSWDYINYATVKNSRCFVLSFIFSYSNPGVFEKPPLLFDQEKEFEIFGQMLSSFKFTEK